MQHLTTGFNWMSEQTKRRVAVRVASMYSYIGYPEALSQMGGYEHKMRVRPNFLHNLLLIKKAKALKKLVQFNGPYQRTLRQWPDRDFPVSWHRGFELSCGEIRVKSYIHWFQPGQLSYHKDENAMIIPATLLTFPSYVESAPFWVNVLSLGFRISHQLFHLMVDQGSNDNLGRRLNGSSWTAEEKDEIKVSGFLHVPIQFRCPALVEVSFNVQSWDTICPRSKFPKVTHPSPPPFRKELRASSNRRRKKSHLLVSRSIMEWIARENSSPTTVPSL